jgi:hypothetical protein
MTLKAYLRKMGQIDGLAQAHGTVARAIEEALLNGNAARLTNLQDQIRDFQQDLEQCANETTTSKSTLLKLMTRIRAQNVKQLEALGMRMQVLESWLNFGVAHAPVVVPIGIPNAMRVSPQRTSSLDADTVFGVGLVGEVDVDLSMNTLFGLVKSLDAKVQILAERAKNTGVLFHEITYASEKEFCLAYHPLNPSVKGVAGFVDIISIWNFAAIDHGDSASWLTKQKNAKSVGFTHALDAKHAYSMGVQCPSLFAATNKEDLTSLSTIKMLKIIAAWHGNGLGDGYKEKFTEAVTQAIRGHKKYCKDFVPKGWLRNRALWSGQYTQYF